MDGITWEETQDPQACNGPEEEYITRSRDPCRSPFQWDSSTFAGFSEVIDEDPWLPIHSDYETNNLEVHKNEPTSTYNYYRALIALRKEPEFVYGEFKLHLLSDNVFAYTRSHTDRTYAVIANVGANMQKVSLNEMADNIPAEIEIVLPGIKSHYEKG